MLEETRDHPRVVGVHPREVHSMPDASETIEAFLTAKLVGGATKTTIKGYRQWLRHRRVVVDRREYLHYPSGYRGRV